MQRVNQSIGKGALRGSVAQNSKLGGGASLPDRLQDALDYLAGLEKECGGLRQELADGREQLAETQEQRAAEIAEAEHHCGKHGAGSHAVSADEARLRAEARRADERHGLIEEAMASELYWRWKEAFESHMRKGGRFDDFPVDGFFQQVFGTVSAAGLDPLRIRTEQIETESAALAEQASAAAAHESQLGMELAALAEQVQTLQSQAKANDVTNRAWREDRLMDGVRRNNVRAEEAQVKLDKEELEQELQASHRLAAATSEAVWQMGQAAAKCRAQMRPAKERVILLQEQAVHNQQYEEQVRQRIAVKQTELSKHEMLVEWDVETQRADQDGHKYQREALVILQRVAREKDEARADEKRLEKVLGRLREKHREGAALNSACNHTDRLLNTTTKELYGLRAAHAELRAEREAVRRQLLVARADATEKANQLQTSEAGLQEAAALQAAAAQLPASPARGSVAGSSYGGRMRDGYAVVSEGCWSPTRSNISAFRPPSTHKALKASRAARPVSPQPPSEATSLRTGSGHVVPRALPMSSGSLRGATSQQRRAL